MGVARSVPDPDDVPAETGGQEIVKERAHQVRFGQVAQWNLVALGPGQDLPAVSAGEKPGGGEGHGGQKRSASLSPLDFLGQALACEEMAMMDKLKTSLRRKEWSFSFGMVGCRLSFTHSRSDSRWILN
jgi:hypothetical protein